MPAKEKAAKPRSQSAPVNRNPFFEPQTRQATSAEPALSPAPQNFAQGELDWNKQRLTDQTGSAIFRSREYKNMVVALDTYQKNVALTTNPLFDFVPSLYELQHFCILWLEKNKNNNQPKVEARRKVIEELAYVDILKEITRKKEQYTRGTDKGEIGKGQVGAIRSIEYYLPDGESEVRYFKEAEEGFDKDVDSAVSSGIPFQRSLLANRAVASSVLDKLFGLGVTVDTDFALSVDQNTGKESFGIAMAPARGLSPQITGPKQEGGDTMNFYREMDLLKPGVQQQMATLQVMDAITGQVDRHPGNYFIHFGGGSQVTVTGIDNDFSFGKSKDSVTKQNSPADKFETFPIYLDKSVADKLRSKSPDEVRAAIRPLLPPAEVDATVSRFQQVLLQLDTLEKNNQLLDPADWNAQTGANQPNTYLDQVADSTRQKQGAGRTLAFDPAQDPKTRSANEKAYLADYDFFMGVVNWSVVDYKKGIYPFPYKGKPASELKQGVQAVYDRLVQTNNHVSQVPSWTSVVQLIKNL